MKTPSKPRPAVIEVLTTLEKIRAAKPKEEVPSCPQCKYQAPDDEFAPKPLGKDALAICLNCGEFMVFDDQLDDADRRVWGTPTPEPLPATSMDFAKYTPDTVKRLLNSQSMAHKLAQMRGYHLGKLKFRSGRA